MTKEDTTLSKMFEFPLASIDVERESFSNLDKEQKQKLVVSLLK